MSTYCEEQGYDVETVSAAPPGGDRKTISVGTLLVTPQLAVPLKNGTGTSVCFGSALDSRNLKT